MLYARLPDCTGCSGQLGFISAAVDNREGDGERAAGKEGGETLKGRKTRNTGRKEAAPEIPEKSLFSLLLRNENDLGALLA